MNWDELDVVAAAKDRVNRVEGKKLMTWTVISVAIMMVGVYLVQATLFGYVVGAVGILSFLWKSDQVTKKQKRMIASMLNDYRNEQKSSEARP